MWVFIVLLLIGCTIIVTRTFLNGTREAEPIPSDAPAPKAAPVQASGTLTGTKAVQPTSAYPPPAAEQPGGACASCGTETVPGAKFCGECGHRLVS